MNDKQITKAQRPGGDLVIHQDVGLTLKEVSDKLAYLIVNGRKLIPEERIALAQYAIATGLNPFNQECWYLPGKGPGPGVAGYRRRAQEQLYWEASQVKGRVAPDAVYYWFTWEEITEGDRFYHPDKGDIRYKAILHDSLTRNSWEARIIVRATEFIKGGVAAKDAYELARDLVGPEPTWDAEATVYGDESFAKDNRPDKWDRRERCKKRAESWAIKKRFNLQIPSPAGWDVEAIDATFQEPQAQLTERTIDQSMSELGFETKTTIEYTPPMPEEPVDVTLVTGTEQPQQNEGARPYNPDTLKAKLLERSKKYEGKPASDRLRKVVASCMGTIFDGDESKRHIVLQWLTGYQSTKEIPDSLIHAIATDWLETVEFNAPPNPDAITEARAVWATLDPQRSLPL